MLNTTASLLTLPPRGIHKILSLPTWIPRQCMYGRPSSGAESTPDAHKAGYSRPWGWEHLGRDLQQPARGHARQQKCCSVCCQTWNLHLCNELAESACSLPVTVLPLRPVQHLHPACQ